MRLDARRARRWLAGLLGAVAAATGCAGCDRGSDDAPPAPAKLDVGLTVTTRRAPDALVIEYTLTNRERRPVTAFTGVPKRDVVELPVVDPDAVYVTARRDGVAEIAKRVFAPPEGVHPYAYFVLQGAVVQPGERYGETVRVSLPLKARRPYDSDARLPANARKAVFCVGVMPFGAAQPQPQQESQSQQPSQQQPTQQPSGAPAPALHYAHSEYVANAQQLVCGELFNIV